MTWPVTPNPGIHNQPQQQPGLSISGIFGGGQFQNLFEKMIISVIWELVSTMITAVGGTPPSTPPTDLASLLQDMAQALINLPLDIINDIVGALTGSGGNLGNLTSWANQIPLIGPLITALGGSGTSSSGITDLASAIESFPQEIVNTFLSFLSGGTTTSGSTSTMSGLLNNVPLIGPLISGLGGSGSGISGLITAIEKLPQEIIDELLSFLSGGALTTGGTSDLTSQLQNIPLVGPLISALAGSGSGVSGISGLSSIFGDISSLLGNPTNLGTGGFNLLGSAESMLSGVLTPAGALTSSTQLPAHLFGNLVQGNAAVNLLPDPGFNNASALSGQSLWSWDGTVDHTGTTGSGSAKTTGAGVKRQLLGVPISASPGQKTAVSTYVKWSGVTAPTSGQSILLAASSYNASGTLLADTPIQAIVNPGSSSTGFSGTDPIFNAPLSADSHGWVFLGNSFTTPANTAYVRLSMEVNSVVSAGNVWFDDASHTAPTGLVDGSLLNVASLPQIPASSIMGIQGLNDMGSTVQSMWDGFSNVIGNILGLSGISSSGNTLSTVTSAIQSGTQASNMAQNLGVSNSNTLAIVNNRPASAGLEATVESNMSLSTLGTSSTPTSFGVTQAVSGGTWVRLTQAKTLGFMQWVGYGTGTITALYLNFGKVNSIGNIDPLFSSANLVSAMNAAWGWQLYNIPTANLINVSPGDQIAVEFQVVGSGTYNVAGQSMLWLQNHPTANTKQTGFTRNTGSGGSQSLSILSASIAWSGNAPYVGFGVGSANIPPPIQLPQTTTYNSAGSFTWTPPSWLVSGNHIDLIGIGGGGSGQGEQGYNQGNGGHAGTWQATTLLVGTDISVGGTISVTVGAGGAQQIQYFTDGLVGGATTFQWSRPAGGGTQTLTCAGGAGGTGPAVGAVWNGQAAGNETYNGVTYTGGGSVGASSTGASPGGGGGGAAVFVFPGAGAPGQAWLVARQS